MDLNQLLLAADIDPKFVLVLRHRPHERELRKVLPWLAAEQPEVFNAFQQSQAETVERSIERLKGKGFVASFIGHAPGKALFVGLYKIVGSKPLDHDAYWKIPANHKLKEYGCQGFTGEKRATVLWFDLSLEPFHPHWMGKLVVDWPKPERSWFRRAHKNEFRVLAILEDSALDAAMPDWRDLVLSWHELNALPAQWRNYLAQWRGIYYIFDNSDGKGYVGAAYGQSNILGRWQNYAASGHGGNQLLLKRDPENFEFSILQRVSPDMEAHEVTHLEGSWKQRLHTRKPFGLNDN